MIRLFSLALVALASMSSSLFAAEQWITFAGKDGPGHGKQVVLVSGDEEYRSEEALPQLAKILAERHGFKCTVVFAIDPKTGQIDPNVRDNIPGLAALDSADLMIIATRFRDLPDDQMQHIVKYVESGKPIIGMRTATHAFNIGGDKTYAKYSFNSREWPNGFGKQVLGETWVNHHGAHGSQSTRGILATDAKDHPILRGLKDGDIWGPTDVYTVNLPLPGDSQPLVYGQVLQGMKFDDPPLAGPKNDPMMPVAWVKSFETDSGKKARIFTTTMGAATDLAAAGTRRMLVNAAYWCVGLEDKIPAEGTNVELVGEFHPSPFGFNKAVKGKTPADYK
jgi:type 1 glutamine amidotransferase